MHFEITEQRKETKIRVDTNINTEKQRHLFIFGFCVFSMDEYI